MRLTMMKCKLHRATVNALKESASLVPAAATPTERGLASKKSIEGEHRKLRSTPEKTTKRRRINGSSPFEAMTNMTKQDTHIVRYVIFVPK